jgi:DNA replication protein DnaC
MSQTIDGARLTLLLNDLRLPAIKQGWAAFAERADKEGWPAARFLASLAEHEVAERDRRRIERHLIEARLLPGKTLDAFEFEAVPMVSKAHVMAICAGDSWIDKGANLILIGGPGGGKTHLASAIGLALVENGWRVLFARTSDLVQKLQVARRELGLEAAINRLDRFHLLILDDLAYVSKDQAETSVLFELISARYERRSTLITANQPFGAWSKVFPDPAMTLAAVDRRVSEFLCVRRVSSHPGSGHPPYPVNGLSGKLVRWLIHVPWFDQSTCSSVPTCQLHRHRAQARSNSPHAAGPQPRAAPASGRAWRGPTI